VKYLLRFSAATKCESGTKDDYLAGVRETQETKAEELVES